MGWAKALSEAHLRDLLTMKRKPQTTKSCIDFEELLARTENDRELMRDLLSIFKEEFPEREKSFARSCGVSGCGPSRLGESLRHFERIAKELTRQLEVHMAEVSG